MKLRALRHVKSLHAFTHAYAHAHARQQACVHLFLPEVSATHDESLSFLADPCTHIPTNTHCTGPLKAVHTRRGLATFCAVCGEGSVCTVSSNPCTRHEQTHILAHTQVNVPEVLDMRARRVHANVERADQDGGCAWRGGVRCDRSPQNRQSRCQSFKVQKLLSTVCAHPDGDQDCLTRVGLVEVVHGCGACMLTSLLFLDA